MRKKVFDVLPPKKLEKLEGRREETLRLKKRGLRISLPKIAFSKGILVIFLILIVVVLTAYFYLPKAEIEIWPETELKAFEVKLTVDKRAENINLISNLMPGIIFEEEKIITQEFSSTGKKLLEKKAEGIIRVFNDSQQEQILVAQTRFQPPLEKFRPSLEAGENPWFRTNERIVIPARGYKDVKAVADAPGEKYNIEPSTFSVPGLAGGPQYTFVYAKSFESMKDGLKKEVAVVTQEDLKEAEEALKQKAVREIKDAIAAKIPPEFIVLEKDIQTEILETFSSARAGAELEKFSFQVKTGAKVMSFKKEDLENFSKEFIISKIPADKKLDQKSLRLNYLPETINLEAGKISLSLNIEAKIYSDINEIALREGLSGKSSTETQFFLQNQPEIKQAQVKLWPFWVSKVPEKIERTKIRITVD